MVLFRIFGVLEVDGPAESLRVSAEKPRRLLLVLLARANHWAPIHSAEFTSGLDGGWSTLGPEPGRDTRGRRTPDQLSFRDGVLTITGLANGDTGYLRRRPGSRHGRWEARIRVPAGCPCYRPVLTLWPDRNDPPFGGEIVYLEALDADRQSASFYLYSYGDKPDRLAEDRRADLTSWTNVAVEWTSDHLTGYLNGEPWFHTTRTELLPPRAMHPTIKLDLVDTGTPPTTSTMQVDWIREYGL